MRPELTVRETLELYAGYYREPLGVAETIEHVGLADKAETRAGRLSGGQLRRLDVGAALVGDPDLLFLDEPTTGFDPSARRQAWGVIAGLRDLGKTVFLTTHYMDEAQRLADRVAIIAAGRIVAEGRPDELGDRESRPATISFRLPAGTTLDGLPAGLEPRASGDGEMTLTTQRPVEALNRLTGWALERSLDLDGLEVGRPSLEDVYLELTASEPERDELSASSLVLHQFRYDQKSFWRNPASVFFTVALPLIFLFIFATIFGNDTLEELGGIKTTTYYVPAILTLAIVSATMQSVAIQLTVDRENGVLKRGRGTPLPAWVFFAGRAGNAIVISALMLVVVPAIGRVIYDVAIPWDHLPAVLVTLAVGAASFCCLGIALTAAIPSEDAAPAVTNVTVLPLYFLSGVFIPETEIPEGVLKFADLFPIRHFFEAFFAAWDPATSGAGFEWGHLAVVAAWGALGLGARDPLFSLDAAPRLIRIGVPGKFRG